MTKATTNPILQQITRLVGGHRLRDVSDSALLGLLAERDNRAAFEALVLRHGPMVLDVCRCALANEADAEDAFQATFVVLARKAGSIRKAAALSSWLHGVAYRTALKAKADFARREKHESRVHERKVAETDDPTWREVRQIIHEELNRIPERDRAPLVLCYVRGMTQDEAATLLKLPKGTLRGRLERGRALLRKRLVKRGLGPSGLAVLAAWPTATTFAAQTTKLLDVTVTAATHATLGKVAAGVISARVIELAETIMKHAIIGKWTGLTYALGLAVVIGVGAGALVPGNGPIPAAIAEAGPATSPIGSDATNVDPAIAKLIGQLGSPKFAERQAADKELRKLGARAIATLKHAMRSADAEIAMRASNLEPLIRADEMKRFTTAFQPDQDGAKDIDHPLWARFKKLVGNDRDSRKLFAELISSPQRAQMLDDVEANPETAGEVYARQVIGYAKALQEGGLKSTIPFERLPTTVDVVAVMFLGTYPNAAKAASENGKLEFQVVTCIEVAQKDPGFAAKARLFAAWLGARTEAETMYDGLNFARNLKMNEVGPLLQKWIADPAIAPRTRAMSALYLGDIGAPEDWPRLRTLAESKAAAEPFEEFNVIVKGQAELDALWGRVRLGGEKVSSEEWKKANDAADIRKGSRSVADCAWTAAVHLAGGKPTEMGFFWPQTVRGKSADYARNAHLQFSGFPDEKARAVAHAAAKAFLDKQPVPEPKANAPKPDAESEKLVQQLGSPKFTDREAAEKALRSLGAKAAMSVRAGMKDADAEIAKRCESIWPKLWETEIARPDADRLAGYEHPIWIRFRKTIGDDPGSRTLFAEMVADVRRFNLLEAVEADPPTKASDAYAAELKLRVERMKQAYREAEKAARDLSGRLWPYGGIPTRGEYAALLFLGTYPSTSAVTFKEADDNDRVSHHGVFGIPLKPRDLEKAEPIPPALRRLFAAWLATRTDPNPIQFGTSMAIFHGISEAAPTVAPTARKAADNAELAPKARGFALLAVGRFGTPNDLPLLEKAFSDSRVFDETKYTSDTGQTRPVEALVSDTAIAAALKLSGQHPADFGFPLLEMYKERGPDTLAKYHLIGFFDGDTRKAAHKKAKEWLDKQKKERPKLKFEP